MNPKSVGVAVLAAALIACAGFAIAEDEEPKPTSAVVIAQCGRVIGLVVVDSKGKLHPVPPEAMSDKVLGEVMKEVGASYVVAQTPCTSQRNDVTAL